MKFTLLDLYSLSIGIAAIISVIRFRKINPVYYPFIYCIWLAFSNEVLGYFLIYSGHSNAVNINIYVLFESLLITWQFRKWLVFERYKKPYLVLLVSFLVFWIIEAFFVLSITLIFTYFRVYYSFIIVLMSIDTLNRILVREKTNLLKNPVFLICVSFVIYYTFTVIVGIFWIYGFAGSRSFRRNLGWVYIYINFFSNLIYAFAVLWMPKKLRFSLPY